MKKLNLVLIIYLLSTVYLFLFFIPDMKNRLSIEGMQSRNCDIDCRDTWYYNNTLSFIDKEGNISLLALIIITFFAPLICIGVIFLIIINEILLFKFTI